MLRVQPFLALRPAGSRAVLVSCPPVGVPCGCCDDAPPADSFRQVLGERCDAGARCALERLIGLGALCADPEPRMFIYRIARDGRRQIGVVACVHREDLDGDVAAAPSWAEPGIVTFDDPEFAMAPLAADDMNERPIFHFNAGDGITHTGWLARDPLRYVRAFAALGGRGELLSPAATAGDGTLLALLMERSGMLDPRPEPRCGLFVQRAVLAT